MNLKAHISQVMNTVNHDKWYELLCNHTVWQALASGPHWPCDATGPHLVSSVSALRPRPPSAINLLWINHMFDTFLLEHLFSRSKPPGGSTGINRPKHCSSQLRTQITSYKQKNHFVVKNVQKRIRSTPFLPFENQVHVLRLKKAAVIASRKCHAGS